MSHREDKGIQGRIKVLIRPPVNILWLIIIYSEHSLPPVTLRFTTLPYLVLTLVFQISSSYCGKSVDLFCFIWECHCMQRVASHAGTWDAVYARLDNHA